MALKIQIVRYPVLQNAECVTTSILCGITEVILDSQQLIVLGKTVGAAHATSLDLTGFECDYEVSNEVVLGLTGAVGNDGGVTVALCKVNGLEGLGQGADLVDLDQDGVAYALLKTHLQSLYVGYEEVVTDELATITNAVGQHLPTIPVILSHAV